MADAVPPLPPIRDEDEDVFGYVLDLRRRTEVLAVRAEVRDLVIGLAALASEHIEDIFAEHTDAYLEAELPSRHRRHRDRPPGGHYDGARRHSTEGPAVAPEEPPPGGVRPDLRPTARRHRGMGPDRAPPLGLVRGARDDRPGGPRRARPCPRQRPPGRGGEARAGGEGHGTPAGVRPGGQGGRTAARWSSATPRRPRRLREPFRVGRTITGACRIVTTFDTWESNSGERVHSLSSRGNGSGAVVTVNAPTLFHGVKRRRTRW